MAELKAKQYRLHGLSNNGEPKEVLLSNEVSGKIHLWSTGGNVWVDQNELCGILARLVYGEDPVGRHAKKETTDEVK